MFTFVDSLVQTSGKLFTGGETGYLSGNVFDFLKVSGNWAGAVAAILKLIK